MLGLVLLYFIGKSFYKLAEESGKSAWGFVILGIAIFYLAQIIAAVIIYSVMISNGQYIDDINESLVSIMAIPFGLLAWWGLHTYLKKKWFNNRVTKQTDVLDDVLID